jgi:integrase/recombinase XerC
MPLQGSDARAVADSWLKELAEQRRLSPHTVEAYGRDLEALLELTGDTPLDELQPQAIRRFTARLHARDLSGRSLARMLSAWRGFYRWLGKRNLVALNPVQAVRPPRSKKALPSVLSPDQARALLEGTVEDVLELRDRAMFELFYSSGLRLSELASLDCRGGLDLKEGEVTVTGKRGKTRLVPVGAAAREALTAWLARREEIASGDEPALFLSRRGDRLSVRSMEARLERWGLKQGLGVHVHPHMLRHSFASHVLQSSGDLRAVQEMLGHSSIASTQIYTHLDFQHLAQVYDAAHPRAKKK